MLTFSKMHGIGNDYIYINCFQETVTDPEKLSIFLSDVRFGIGSDGLVLILPSEVADFRMRIFNADGSEAMMCGNATRCIGKYVYDMGMTDKTEISLETNSGIKYLTLYPGADNMIPAAGVGVQLGVVGRRPDAPALQQAGSLIHLFCGAAIDDTGVIALLQHQFQQAAGLFAGQGPLGGKVKVGPVEAGSHLIGIAQGKMGTDVIPHMSGGGGRECAHHRPRQYGWQRGMLM